MSGTYRVECVEEAASGRSQWLSVDKVHSGRRRAGDMSAGGDALAEVDIGSRVIEFKLGRVLVLTKQLKKYQTLLYKKSSNGI
jgi:hypothetical protein